MSSFSFITLHLRHERGVEMSVGMYFKIMFLKQ